MPSGTIARHECGRLIIRGQTCVCQTLDKERNAGIGATQTRKKG